MASEGIAEGRLGETCSVVGQYRRIAIFEITFSLISSIFFHRDARKAKAVDRFCNDGAFAPRGGGNPHSNEN